MKVLIRQMMVDDLDTVLEIERDVYANPWSRKSFEFEVRANRFGTSLVLEKEGAIIGYAVIWIIFTEFHIANLVIRKDYQGRGYGKFLLKEMLKLADGQEYALLEVRPSNHRALELYKKFGFKAVHIRKSYYHDGEDAIIMRKEFPREEAEAPTLSGEKSEKNREGSSGAGNSE